MNATVVGLEDRPRIMSRLSCTQWRASLLPAVRHDARRVESALRLRFELFNLELHKGIAESFFTGMDEDAFDRFETPHAPVQSRKATFGSR